MNTDLQKVAKEWKNYIKAKNALIEIGVNRSYKSSVGDFAEWLIAKIYDGTLPESKSETDYDVITRDKKIQVKSIAKMKDNPNGYIIRDKDKNNKIATHYAFVYFEDLIPKEIYLTPKKYLIEYKKAQIKIGDLRKTNYRVDFNLKLFENEPPALNSSS